MAARRRSRDERTIADAWRAAKAADPSLTQRDFANDAFPAYVERHGKRRFRSVDTRARDLRRILSGKDTRARTRPIKEQAAGFMRAARQQRGVNVEITDSKGRIVGYGNIALEPGMTTFDMYKLTSTPEGMRLARSIARQVRRSSPPHEIIDFDIGPEFRPRKGRVISRNVGSPAGEQHIRVVRQLRDPGSARYVGRFGPGGGTVV